MTYYPLIALLTMLVLVPVLKAALVGCDYALLSSGSGVCGLGGLLGDRGLRSGLNSVALLDASH